MRHPIITMNTLSELALLEERLLTRLASIDGFLEERHVVVERTGIPNEYAAIVTMYTDLLVEPGSRAESLKRATFLVWYAVTEPAEFTGLNRITLLHTQRVMRELERELANTGGDDELRAMLRWYASVMAGCPFIDFPECPEIAQFVAEAESTEEGASSWRPLKMDGRGQMGTYWKSLHRDA